MITGLSHVTLYVKDQDEALKWYTEVLGLQVRTDARFGDEFRWLTVGAAGQPDLEIILFRPVTPDHEAQLGKQNLGVFATDDCRRDIETLRSRGVKILREPQDQPYGVEASFEDLYGNGFALVQPSHS